MWGWTRTVAAADLLIDAQELRVEDAVAALAEAGVSVFQPAQLLPLYPQVVGWAAAAHKPTLRGSD